MNEAQARKVASEFVELKSQEAGIELVLLDDETMERGFGWVFFFDSKRHTETQNFEDSVVGNAPFVVMRADGSVRVTGTAHPIEYYLTAFGD
ncbi:hypothetical protein U91I_00433 [alpha proteobacterium U9-1i]|nr:hypothetical protein U91I_00433 [alpha proteobacterium U9-1i]